ncbi:MAG: ParA family protein [Planctomycetota bacterium]|jgi:chromosome partitioning protein
MRRIAILNQKGGVGKTTTTVNLAAALAKMKKRVLVIDIDPQANLSVHLNVDITAPRPTIYEVLTGSHTLADAIQHIPDEGFDLVSSNIDLAGAEIELVNAMGREIILLEAVEAFIDGGGDYDYLFIDCPPSLGLLTINALTSVNELFIPLQVQFFALQGISKLLEIISLVRRRLNPDIDLTGIIPVMFDQRTRLSHQVLKEIKSFFKRTVTRSMIRFNVRLAEAPSHGKSIFRYARTSYGAEDYMGLAREINRMKRETRAFKIPKASMPKRFEKPQAPVEAPPKLQIPAPQSPVGAIPESEVSVEGPPVNPPVTDEPIVPAPVAAPATKQPEHAPAEVREQPPEQPAEEESVEITAETNPG